MCKDAVCLPACVYNEPVLGSQKKAYDPKTQCCTRTGVQPKLKGFDAQACRETLTARPNFKPTFNGCGTKEDKFPDTWPGPGAKIGKAKYRGPRANFGTACNLHDICYDTCGKPKDTCDKEFCKRLNKSCTDTWPGAKQSAWRGRCESEAGLYCAGVALAGDAAYWKAQGEACQCCP